MNSSEDTEVCMGGAITGEPLSIADARPGKGTDANQGEASIFYKHVRFNNPMSHMYNFWKVSYRKLHGKALVVAWLL